MMLFMRRARAGVLAGSVALSLVACGSQSGQEDQSGRDEPDVGVATGAGFPVEVEGALGTVTIPAEPERIVSLSPTATESLFAVGAGDQVAAVDDQSDYPEQAPMTDLSGFQPNLEAIIEYRPDLVVVSDDSPTDVTDGLEAAGVPVLAAPAATSFDEAYDQILGIGAATGHLEEAQGVVEGMRTEIEVLLASVQDGPELTVFHELSPDLYTASSGTFIGQVYAGVGLANIADEAAEQSGNDYPQLSAEYLISSDPDLVMLADAECCDVTPEAAAQRPGWDAISAVRTGAVVLLDEDISSRWGPRIPVFVEAAVEAIGIARGAEGARSDAAGPPVTLFPAVTLSPAA